MASNSLANPLASKCLIKSIENIKRINFLTCHIPHEHPVENVPSRLITRWFSHDWGKRLQHFIIFARVCPRRRSDEININQCRRPSSIQQTIKDMVIAQKKKILVKILKNIVSNLPVDFVCIDVRKLLTDFSDCNSKLPSAYRPGRWSPSCPTVWNCNWN